MIITYHGLQFFKIQFGDMVIASNPPGKDSSLKAPRFGADIVLVSLHHKDFDGAEELSFGNRKPFVISSPGEYEVKEVAIKGFASKSMYGGEERVNTIYTVHLEGMQLSFLGALSDATLPTEAKEAFDAIDVLFVAVGEGTLSPKDAYKCALSIEPKLIIPVVMGGDEKKIISQFLKEAGEGSLDPQEKLTLKKKDLEGKDSDIVILKQV